MEHVNDLQGTGDLSILDLLSARAPRIAVEDWWLLLARDLVEKYPAGLVVLGRELAKEVGRQQAYSHSLLSKFANKKIGATRDLQEAICKKFRLPPPIFFPRTFSEASQMLEVKERHDREIERLTPPPGSVATVEPFPQPHARRLAHTKADTSETPSRATHGTTTRRR